jgi:hypothetical protein
LHIQNPRFMKKELLFFILIVSFKLTLGQSLRMVSDSDTCSPSFKDIYDFQVGDVFQYVKKSWASGGGAGYNTKTTLKYTITNKTGYGDTLIYPITGIKKFERYCDIGPFPGCEYYSESSLINDILIFIDSATHYLNCCNNELISNFIPEEYYWDSFREEFGELYTKIQTQTSEGNPEKKTGGQTGQLNNLYIYNEEDSLVRTNDIQYEAVYAKNLGIIKEYFWYFEFDENDYLQGSIKHGDTTGMVSSDEDLLTSFENKDLKNDMVFYPNPTDGAIFYKSDDRVLRGAEIEITDSRGSVLFNQYLTTDFIDVTGLNKGLYFLKIKVKNNITVSKVVVQ